MIAALAVPIMLPSIDPPVDPLESLADLFALKDATLTFLMKRPYIDDLDIVRLHAGMTEEQELELAKICSMQDEKMWQAHELERVTGAGTF